MEVRVEWKDGMALLYIRVGYLHALLVHVVQPNVTVVIQYYVYS